MDHIKICLIYQDEYPWDIRVDKMINSFANYKITTHIVSRNRTGLAIYEKLSDYMFIHRLSKGIGSAIRNAINFPAFFSPFWFFKVFWTVKKFNVDMLLVRDLPLAPTAYFVGKLMKKPVIMDLAENYPAMIKDTWTYRGPSIIDYIIRNPFLLKLLEKCLLPRMDGLIVVSSESETRVKRLLKKNQTPIWIVGNTPDLQFAETKLVHPLADILKSHMGLSLLYVGGLEESRGLEIVIRALPIITEKIDDILLVIIGNGSSLDKLMKLSSTLKVNDKIIFAKWIEFKYVPSIISQAKICIIPHYVTEHTNTTLPNKIFDYMAQKKPVVVSNAESLVNIVNSCKCGKSYHDKDFVELAQIVIELDDTELRRQMGQSGFAAVKERYNWAIEEKNLLESIQLTQQNFIGRKGNNFKL